MGYVALFYKTFQRYLILQKRHINTTDERRLVKVGVSFDKEKRNLGESLIEQATEEINKP